MASDQPYLNYRSAMAKPYDRIPDRRAIVRRRDLEAALAGLVEDMPRGCCTAASATVKSSAIANISLLEGREPPA